MQRHLSVGRPKSVAEAAIDAILKTELECLDAAVARKKLEHARKEQVKPDWRCAALICGSATVLLVEASLSKALAVLYVDADSTNT